MLPRFAYLWPLVLIMALAACSTKPPQVTSPTSQTALITQLERMSLKSPLPIPVDRVRSHQLTDTWGAARSSGRRHEGIDILAPRGTKVFSTTHGVIADLRDNNLGGKVVWIRGPAGSWHYYAHLDGHARGLKVGDYVKPGQLIAYVGNTGNAKHTAAHLHYGIYLSGKGRGVVNPYSYLREF